MAKVIPFPLARRRSFVERHARLIGGMNARTGERHLGRQLRIQFESLERKDIDRVAIEREVASLNTAIRAALWQAASIPGQR